MLQSNSIAKIWWPLFHRARNTTIYYPVQIFTMVILRWIANSMRDWDGGLRAKYAVSKKRTV